ncbi:tripartite tricarboxylate transporter permease [Sporomusa aerivorans]|uniref:tripartite tricarboxylate transporter permease n=1 Tax=Sporomusa aerivorans TaxID=204936 RepID=UPI003529F9AC
MDILTMLLNGFYISISPANLLACIAGVLIGTLVGVLPGIGPVGTIALLLPFSFSLDATASLIMFAGIYYGSMFGGSTTSILLNVPGEASSVVTCLDGYAMAKKGRAGAALAIAAIGSLVAGTMGLIGLTFFAPLMSRLAVTFGPPEYFAIALVGLLLLMKFTGKSMLKSGLMVVVGIMLGTIGLDSLTGVNRFTFDVDELQRGIEFSIVAMGVFGVSEILDTLVHTNREQNVQSFKFRDLYPSREELRRSVQPIFRGGIIGFLVGLLPGPAATISTFVSYAVEKRKSKRPEEFGQGAIEGVAGPESANNAAASATMIPLLSLGLPFSASSAILLSGFLIHGIVPGPTLVTQNPDLFWGLIASMYLGNVILLIVNLPLVGLFTWILKIPINILMPVVLMITMTGAYSINNSIFDVALLIFFGVLGFFMKQADYEPAPLALGLILGPVLENGLAQGLIIGDGSVWFLFTRPISGTILWLGVALLVFQTVCWFNKQGKRKTTQSGEREVC